MEHKKNTRRTSNILINNKSRGIQGNYLRTVAAAVCFNDAKKVQADSSESALSRVEASFRARSRAVTK